MRAVVLCLVLVVVGACGSAQSAICKKYIACEQAYEKASATGPVDLTQYEASGVCWQSDANAQLCDQQCTDGVTAVRQAATAANLDVAACRQ